MTIKTADTQAQPFCFNFSPTALFSAKPFGYHFCKSKRGALFFTYYFGMHHICFCPTAPKAQLPLKQYVYNSVNVFFLYIFVTYKLTITFGQ